MAQQKKTRLTDTFHHPSAGTSTRVDRYVAVRWRGGVNEADKAKTLRASGVELVGPDEKAPRPLARSPD
jgi:hypothetical protein